MAPGTRPLVDDEQQHRSTVLLLDDCWCHTGAIAYQLVADAAHPRDMTPQELLSDYLAAAKSGDWDKAFGYFAEDIVVHVPGRSAFAGDRRGKAAAVGYIQKIRDRYRHGKIELELIDMLASDRRVALLVQESFHGDGPLVQIRRANVYRVQGDKIVEITIFEADQYAVDELLHHAGPR